MEFAKNETDGTSSYPGKEILERYPDSFYEEIDPGKRAAILRAAPRDPSGGAEEEFRRKLFQARYGDSVEKGKPADGMMKLFLNMKYLSDNPPPRFLRKREAAMLKKEIAGLLIGEAAESGAEGKRALFQEVRHMARVYISLCATDRQYGSVVLGIGHIREETLVKKIARDLAVCAHKIPAEYGLSDILSEWTKAVDSAFSVMYPGKEEIYHHMTQEGEHYEK